MNRLALAVVILSALHAPLPGVARRDQRPYFPVRGGWERKAAESVGMDSALLRSAVEFAESHESRVLRDFSTQEKVFGRLLGPIPKMRGGTNGLIIRKGFIVAEFGNTGRVEPIYSAAKSFLSTLLGLAVDRGLIKSVDDPVRLLVKDGGYDSAQNAKVTWSHHARQTSEWEGEMWGKTHSFIGEKEFGEGRRNPRELREPGTFYEYNDVRINRFALSLLRVWRRPLPEVLKKEIMDRVGASNEWRYAGYNNSYVEVNGKRIQSVTGGTRWGGGIWMDTRDLARFGLLFLRNGVWNGKRILSERWIREATTRGTVGPDYGYLWWLNTGGMQWASAPKSSYAAIGYGSNTLWIDPAHDLVIAWRWHDGRMDEMIRRVVAAVKD